MDNIEKAFNEVYTGKEFIYKSKYGRTRCVAKRIYRSETFIVDEDAEKMVKYRVNHSPKGDGTMEKPDLKGEERYMAFQPQFHVESTNGVHYKFTECYFII